ncbi:MAG: PQQ-binding-like beta-propeller repeat protein [Verrucomicrobiota bacterium]
MKHWNQGCVFVGAAVLTFLLVTGCASHKSAARHEAPPILLVVMDPLAKELACACVKGYGQRDYRKLATHLGAALQQRVAVEFSDDLAESLKLASPEQEMLVVGERSFVANSAQRATQTFLPVCELTDVEGRSTFVGTFVAQAKDTAADLKDIAGRQIIFGLADTEANRAAATTTLRAAGWASPKLEKRSVYSDAALDVLDSHSSPPPVAIIPGYGVRLLEGCGSITPGDLKIIGTTAPQPFITVFLATRISAEKKQKIITTLLEIKTNAPLLEAMESRDGFKPIEAKKPGEPQANAGPDWPDWRGPDRSGRVPRLPTRLPTTAKFIWKEAAMTGGLAGLSISDYRLILAERDFADEHDVYRCLHTETGELLWRIKFPARGHLDYGQSPRATPVIHAGRAYLLGAFGDLRCVDITDGKLLWQRQLPQEFAAELPTWGMCSPPLIVDDLLIVNPGGTNASLVALDGVTGQTRWTTPGAPAAYAPFICAKFGGRRQIVGYDQISLGGWDCKTGARLWQLTPPTEGDFNVPTPIAVNDGLLVATENNGTRFYRFDETGRIIPTPTAIYEDLSPDTTTPVVTRGRVFGAHLGLHCLDLQHDLKRIWHRDDDTVGDYATLIADAERVLVITLGGELLLLDAAADDCAIISRLRVFGDEVEVYPHPALIGSRLYLRGGSSVVCLDLKAD